MRSLKSNADRPDCQGPPQRIINQGDIFWAQVERIPEPTTGIHHPHIVIQDDLFNHSRIETVIVCALTSNLKRATEPGNVLLEASEGNLPKPSVIVVSQISTVKKTELGEYIGTLSRERVSQIIDGIGFQQVAFFGRANTRSKNEPDPDSDD
ncbi:MAG: type II toxin-antitoxin system PemK/MazF family toxin [Candidatus Sericytochromatia bacterium]